MTRGVRRPIKLALKLAAAGLLLSAVVSCSPGYVLRAGWEEAGILLRRRELTELIEAPETDPVKREKFKLVLAARKFGEGVGLNAGGSYTQYSEIDRDVLVWVLSAAPRTSFSQKLWWFPIVGSIPYKGFFEKDDGLAEARALQDKGYDTYLRPSVAFSTLGWFDDPLLSTVLVFDDVDLINTVLHEIFHNTVWIPNHAYFNETAANAWGSFAAHQFFAQHDGPESSRAALALNRWHDELLYAEFLATLKRELEQLYETAAREEMPLGGILDRRQQIFDSATARWSGKIALLETDRFKNIEMQLNNAAIIAQGIYLERPEHFGRLFEHTGNSLSEFLKELQKIQLAVARNGSDPYAELEQRLEQLAAGEPAGK